MDRLRFLIVFFLLFTSLFASSQMRYGTCKGATPPDNIYITPFVGAGFANENFMGIKNKIFTYQGGLTALYGFSNFRLGLGGKYQVYKKENVYKRNTIKPFFVLEVPIYFGDFEDFGFYTYLGPSFMQNKAANSAKESAFFIDIGVYYNLIITSSSGLYFGLDYGYNQIRNPISSFNPYHINEFTLNIGYRFWF